MTNDKEKKDIDEYLREMMGTFTDEKKGAAGAGLRNLGIKIPKKKPQTPFIIEPQTSCHTILIDIIGGEILDL